MADKVFAPNDELEIDAEFMEKWLGGMRIQSLSPKTLFDLQTLLSHYKSIVVPMEDVSVEYPVEGFDTACASVDNKKIYIPTGTLEQGLIDDTIGLVVHELNHIKHSEKESSLLKACSSFIMVVLDTIFIPSGDGEYVSLKEMVYRVGFNFQNILDATPKTNTELYFNECLKGVMLLLNSVEDVRIDSICPPNLKKYIDKLDEHGAEVFIPHYKKGELKEDTLMNLVFRLLYHHKGFIKDPVIESSFGDTDYIVTTPPKEYVPVVLNAFRNEIKDYCEACYNDNDFPTPGGQGEDSANDYVQMMEEASADEQFEKLLGEDSDFAKKCCHGVKFEDSQLDENLSSKGQQTVYHKQVEDTNTLLPLPTFMKANIDIFKDVDIVDCHEQFERGGVTTNVSYKTLLIG